MKFYTLILSCLIAGVSLSQDQWVQKDSVNGAPRSVASSFVVNGEGHVLGGLDDNGFRRKMYSYTYWQDDWDQEESIGGQNGGGLNRGSASGFSINNIGYVCLGQGDTQGFMNDLWAYDPSTETWSQKANFGGTPRRQAVAFVLGDFAYVGTGIDAGGLTKDMYRYDPTTNSWSQMNDFAGTPRKEAVGFSMGGQAYIGTGDDGVMRDDFWQYEPTNDSWIQKADFPGTPRKGAVGWGQFPTAFICTGEDINFEYKNDLWEYNYFADTWVQRANFPGNGRTNAIAFIQADLAFVGTGYSGQLEDDMYAYRRILSTEELNINHAVTIFPNPVRDQFTIKHDLLDAKIRVFNTLGQDVTDLLNLQHSGNVISGFRNGLQPGTYYLQVLDNNGRNIYAENLIFI